MFQKTLAQLRMDQNMSQRELAQRLGVSSAAIGMYETGKRNPPLKKALEMAKIFNIPVENISFSNKRKNKRKIQTAKKVSQNMQLRLFEEDQDQLVLK